MYINSFIIISVVFKAHTCISCSDNETTYLCFIVEYLLNVFYCWKILGFFPLSDGYICLCLNTYLCPLRRGSSCLKLGVYSFVGYIYIHIYIYISHIIFLKYIYFNTFVLLEVDFNVYFHSLLTKMAFDVILYSPWSTGSFETHLFGFYCQRITKVCFNSISMDNDYHSAVSVYAYGQRITP